MMFGSKSKEIQYQQKEINRIQGENRALETTISQLRDYIAKLKWEEGKRVVLIDTNAALYYQDLLLLVKGNIVFSWAVVRELLNFREEALFVSRAVNEAIKTEVGGLGWIKYLSPSERRNERINVARAIIGAVKNEKIPALVHFVQKIKYRLKKQGLATSDTEIYKQVRFLFRKHKQVREFWKIFSKKFDTGEWRTVSSSAGLYREILGSKERFQIKSNTDEDVVEVIEMEIGEAVGPADSRIIADAIILQERFEEVILLTRDRRLKEAAETQGIKVAFDVSELETLQ